MKKIFTYKTAGTCCKEIAITMDGEIMADISFISGRPRNLNALRTIMLGKSYKEFLGTFANNQCGNKPVSCMGEFNNLLLIIDGVLQGKFDYPVTEID